MSEDVKLRPGSREEMVSVYRISPNPWNPNTMTDRQLDHLKRELLKREQIAPGGIQNIVLWEVPGMDYSDPNVKYMLIDGEQRWKERLWLTENGHPEMEKVRAVICFGITEKEAKILTLNLNRIRGEPDPMKLSKVVMDLYGTELDDFEVKDNLDYDASDMESFRLMSGAAVVGLPEDDEDEGPLEPRTAYSVWSCTIPTEEMEFVRTVISDVRLQEGVNKGGAFLHVLKKFQESTKEKP